jgi:superfamily II DNA or RNA helicase
MARGADGWTGPEGPVGIHINELNARCLAAYKANPALVEENANGERIQIEGGYGRRQLWELIQNGADEMLGKPGRVEVVLTSACFYCANQGNPVTPEGAGAILSAYRSGKRGPEIGRFGLGFKSVLGVSSSPEFFSRSGSFGFDRDFARDQIAGVLRDVTDVPTLRLAVPLDPDERAVEDETLRELMAWATTVVRLPLDPEKGGWLRDDLAGFPSEFLVFSPHIAELILDDRAHHHRRRIQLAAGAKEFEHRLIEDDKEDVWHVFADEFKPSPEAAKDGGAMANRKVVRYQWAVPVRAAQRIGGLWAYFPTLEDTTLSGVVNAPWKLNDDRTSVIEGPFNREILKNVAVTVLDHLEVLTTKDDPANVLDILPARGREERNWADGFLTELLNSQAAVHPSVPDQTGALALPAGLTLPPPGLPAEALRLWARVPTRPVSWAHITVEANQTRRSRAERFLEASPGGDRATVQQWLEALIPPRGEEDPPQLQASGRALLVAERAVSDPANLELVRGAMIVVDAAGGLARPCEVLLPGEHEVTVPGIRLVHPKLAAHPKAHKALAAVGVRRVDAELELRAVLADRTVSDIEQDWDGLWNVIARVSSQQALSILTEVGFTADNIRVRVASGSYLPLVWTLLPGDIAGKDTAPDVVIDIDHHRDELDVLRLLGATASPAPGGARESEPAMRAFRKEAVETFVSKLSNARPDPGRVLIAVGNVAGPLTPLAALDGAEKARYTRALLESQPSFLRCEVTYPGNRYPAISVEHPVVAAVRKDGLAQTTSGLVGASLWVGPMLRPWASILPVATIPPAAADALQLPKGLEDLNDEQWAEAHRRLLASRDVDLAARFYVVSAKAGGPPPESVLALVGDTVAAVALTELRVTASSRTAAVLRSGSAPVLHLSPDDVERLVEGWGIRRGDDDVASEVVAIETAPRVPLVDQFPALRAMLDERQRELVIARCSEVRIETSGAGGMESETTLFHVDGGVVYVDESLDQPALLRRLGERLGLELDAARIDKIIENKLNQEIRKRITELRKKKTAAEKLAVVVSEVRLRSKLPAPLLTAAEHIPGATDHAGLARLALAVHGVETVKTFVDDFEELGLQPPSRWAGSRQAVDFVLKLGFEREQAGFPGARRESTLEVDGPPALKPLHGYQQTVVDRIREVLRMDAATQRPRGMVALPTGSGKTRVAIQALVEAMKAGDLDSPILWVAQRDELCEQAVQAWSEVWRDRGPNDRLVVSRLWSSNEIEAAPGSPQVVVATIDKLDTSVMRSSIYDWLEKRATCLVIDEAHFALGPSYTRLLEWQGMDHRTERIPLFGLTATPYRGTSTEETERLANRFGSWLDEHAFDGEDPYVALQRMGVLSKVEQRPLKGSDIRLSEDEIRVVTRTRLLPPAASDRLAADVDRNRALLESILSHPDDWTSLIFCTSLEHASVMAGLLTAQGVPTAAVSGNTPPAVRRHYIDEFRAGRIRVLTNYGVFQEGFDAPMVRAVYVARPTYSPNVYQQMIGRGLRGPLNGGSEECLIVNVEDNILNFGEALAFRAWENVWARRPDD